MLRWVCKGASALADERDAVRRPNKCATNASSACMSAWKSDKYKVAVRTAVSKPVKPMKPDQRRAKVLVVDDNLDAAELVGMLVEQGGYEPLVVCSAREALAIASDIVPDIALIDIGLPDMNGYDLTRKLRAQPALANCRFIAITGHTSPSAVARSIAAGFERHLSKPVDPRELLAAIEDRA